MRKSSVSNATATLIRTVVQVDSGDRLDGRPVNRVFRTESPDSEAFEPRVFSNSLQVRKLFNYRRFAGFDAYWNWF